MTFTHRLDICTHCSLWTAYQWTLERGSGHVERDTWYCIAFPHK